jgi:hypothetical protein
MTAAHSALRARAVRAFSAHSHHLAAPGPCRPDRRRPDSHAMTRSARGGSDHRENHDCDRDARGQRRGGRALQHPSELTGHRLFCGGQITALQVPQRRTHLARQARDDVVAHEVGDRQALELASQAHLWWHLWRLRRPCQRRELDRTRRRLCRWFLVVVTRHLGGIDRACPPSGAHAALQAAASQRMVTPDPRSVASHPPLPYAALLRRRTGLRNHGTGCTHRRGRTRGRPTSGRSARAAAAPEVRVAASLCADSEVLAGSNRRVGDRVRPGAGRRLEPCVCCAISGRVWRSCWSAAPKDEIANTPLAARLHAHLAIYPSSPASCSRDRTSAPEQRPAAGRCVRRSRSRHRRRDQQPADVRVGSPPTAACRPDTASGPRPARPDRRGSTRRCRPSQPSWIACASCRRRRTDRAGANDRLGGRSSGSRRGA